MEANPLALVKRPPMGRRAGMADEDEIRVVAAIRSRAPSASSSKAMIDTGCRPGELSGVRAEDIAPDGRAVVGAQQAGGAGRDLTERPRRLTSATAAEAPRRADLPKHPGQGLEPQLAPVRLPQAPGQTGIEGPYPTPFVTCSGPRPSSEGWIRSWSPS
jgi:integrase